MLLISVLFLAYSNQAAEVSKNSPGAGTPPLDSSPVQIIVEKKPQMFVWQQL